MGGKAFAIPQGVLTDRLYYFLLIQFNDDTQLYKRLVFPAHIYILCIYIHIACINVYNTEVYELEGRKRSI